MVCEFNIHLRPVQPGDSVVLRIGVVVAVLGAAGLVAHAQHRRTARQQQRGQQRAHIGGAAGDAQSGETAITGVLGVAARTGTTAREVGDLATALGTEADRLSHELRRFIEDLRAA